jgi:hypothetical protein
MVLSIEGRVFVVAYVFQEGNRYSDLVQQQFAEKFPQTPVTYLNAVRRLIEIFRGTGSIARRMFFHQTFICGQKQNL